VRLRQEFEFTVSDYGAARKLFEALGYEVSLLYEKYRASYLLGGVHVTLDEMPYGEFLEVEGPDPDSIRATAQQLDLDWGARVLDSYTVLFERLRSVMGFTFRDLSFANFKQLGVTLAELGIPFADQKPG
jgi:adenylate cyclase class 2